MHLVVDSNWAKEHPRRAAKIQVAYLVWLARQRDRVCSDRSDADEEDMPQPGRKALFGAVGGS